MKAGLVGIFGDYESAEFARIKLLRSAFVVDRVTLTAFQGPGQSRIATMPAAREKFVRTLRGLFVQDRDPARAERLADRVERGAAAVCARVHDAEEAVRIVRLLKECGASEIVRDIPCTPDASHSAVYHEATWPNYLWPAT